MIRWPMPRRRWAESTAMPLMNSVGSSSFPAGRQAPRGVDEVEPVPLEPRTVEQAGHFGHAMRRLADAGGERVAWEMIERAPGADGPARQHLKRPAEQRGAGVGPAIGDHQAADKPVNFAGGDRRAVGEGARPGPAPPP